MIVQYNQLLLDKYVPKTFKNKFQKICIKCGKYFNRNLKDPQFCVDCRGFVTGGYQIDSEKHIPTMDKLFWCVTCNGHYLKTQLNKKHSDHLIKKCTISFRMDRK